MRVCYFGTYRAEYSRNRIMIEGLRRNGVEVIECNAQLWGGIEDRVEAASGGWMRPGFFWRVIRTYAALLRRYHQVGTFDVMVVGYPGQFDVFPARLLCWLRGRPLVWDVFMSIYLIAVERNLAAQSRCTLDLIRRAEQLAARLPDRLILDTREYVVWFSSIHGTPPTRFRLVPTGADDSVFRPLAPVERGDGTFRVVYYGTFIRNHGTETIIEAARLLADEPGIRFELIGAGPDKPAAEALARQYALANVEFLDWMAQEALLERLAAADVSLGAFGTTPQSLMTVQNKIYEGMAMARPVITGESPTVVSALRHGYEVYLVRRNDPAALADAIRTLRDDPALRARLSASGRALFEERFTPTALGANTVRHLQEVLRGHVGSQPV